MTERCLKDLLACLEGLIKDASDMEVLASCEVKPEAAARIREAQAKLVEARNALTPADFDNVVHVNFGGRNA